MRYQPFVEPFVVTRIKSSSAAAASKVMTFGSIDSADVLETNSGSSRTVTVGTGASIVMFKEDDVVDRDDGFQVREC